MVVVEVNGYTIEPRANLKRANLTGANLRGADLTGVSFRLVHGAEDLAGADFTGAKASGYTTWPPGFDPVVAGVIFG